MLARAAFWVGTDLAGRCRGAGRAGRAGDRGDRVQAGGGGAARRAARGRPGPAAPVGHGGHQDRGRGAPGAGLAWAAAAAGAGRVPEPARLGPPAEAKLNAGTWRAACWLGDGRRAVWGSGSRVVGDVPAEQHSGQRPSGLKLIDTRTWTVRTLHPRPRRHLAGGQAAGLRRHLGPRDRARGQRRPEPVHPRGTGCCANCSAARRCRRSARRPGCCSARTTSPAEGQALFSAALGAEVELPPSDGFLVSEDDEAGFASAGFLALSPSVLAALPRESVR